MDDYDLLKVSIQSALVGQIPDNLFALTCGMNRKRIVIAAYFEDAITEDDRHLLRGLGTEVVADFPDDYSVEERCYSLQQNEPHMLDFWAFLRATTVRRRAVVSKGSRRFAVGC